MTALGLFFNTNRAHGTDSRQFGILFGLMCLWMFALAVSETMGLRTRVLNAAFSLIAIQALLITARSTRERVVFVVLGLALFLEPVLDLPEAIRVVNAFVLGAFLIYIPARLSVFVLQEETVDANTVFGALCAYLFVGLSFAVIYEVGTHMNPDAIYTPEDDAPTFVTWVYFSFTTLTTLGYGDIAPRTYPARMIAILEALIGQIYLVVVVARLVSAHLGSGPRED
jgi:hypothetical protein